MARTPLFRMIQRSLAMAQLSRRTGEPPRELLDRWHEARLSRRQLLGGAALATAGLALSSCGPRRTGEPSSQGTAEGKVRPATKGEVLIIGAGIAGLTAAYRLHQAGVPVRVIEGQERTGGRMYSSKGRFPEGQVIELGGELIDTNHTHMQELAAELGIPLDDFDKDDPAMARDVWFFDGRRYSDAEVVEAFRPIAAKIDEAWETITGETVDYRQPNNGETLDNMTIADFLDEAGADGWFRDLLDVAYTTEYGREIAEQSSFNFLMMIDTNPEPFRIFGESDERFHVRGGNDQIPHALAKALGDRVETGTKLEALSRAADGTYRASVRRGQTSQDLTAERVVLAIPFTLLREVKLDLPLPDVKRKAIQELGYGTNAKLMVGFSDRVWRAEAKSNGSVVTDLPFQLTWETTRLQPGKAGILVNFTGGQHGLDIGQGSEAQQAQAFVRDLERIFPGVAERRTGEARFHWPTFPWMKGSYACYLPGQWTTIAGAEGERVENLHFCGEHTSIDFQGFMEGGCESGTRVAQEILTDLGLAKPEEAEGEQKVA
ncbi:MAG TPA: NAD(P)/FAD-dependent oxidoreductase [Thermoanaerobaculia bacterium]|nr:NAD(P)/FAD-dependent oxidoreductase [Thermoanaerobaculia bacterium]